MKLRDFRAVLPDAAIIRELLDYDPETGVFTWRPRKAVGRLTDKQAGALNSYGYIAIKINGRSFYAHRLAYVHVYGNILGPEDDLDHENRIRSDNRISNLRKACRTQNAANNIRSRHKHNLPRGVGIEGNKFRACIRAFGNRRYLGSFDTVEEAAQAYRTAAAQEFGEFARAP